jgi:hypothetical protein
MQIKEHTIGLREVVICILRNINCKYIDQPQNKGDMCKFSLTDKRVHSCAC